MAVRRSSAQELFERKRQIMDLVATSGFAATAELARRLDVSDETVRRDVRQMLAEGLLKKVRGGVVVPDIMREAGFHHRLNENAGVKEMLGRHGAGLIEPGLSMILTAGSTITYFAHALRGHRGLTIATTSVDVARILGPIPGNSVFVPGGQVRSSDGSIFGNGVERMLREHRARLAVISIEAVTPAGLMSSDLFDADIVRAAADCAEEVMVIAEAAKFNRSASIRALDFDRIATIVSDTPPGPDIAASLNAAGTRLEIVQPGPREASSARAIAD